MPCVHSIADARNRVSRSPVGDEGRVTDLLAERADAVVRFQGGNNAGHTIVRGRRRSSCT